MVLQKFSFLLEKWFLSEALLFTILVNILVNSSNLSLTALYECRLNALTVVELL